jgi:thiamine kinase-like enzyme
VIKVINKQNDQLFIIFEQFFAILDALDTTLYISKDDCIVVERFVPGNVIEDDYLFDLSFFHNILELTEAPPKLEVAILRDNIVLKYIQYLKQYAERNAVDMSLSRDLEPRAQQYITQLEEMVEKGAIKLTFNHLDIQKFNILHDVDTGSINLIDWEYAGYTWEHFDVANMLALLYNAYLEKQVKDIPDQQDAHNHLDELVSDEQFPFAAFVSQAMERYSLTKEYLQGMMYIVCYLWGMWAYAKRDILKDESYVIYAKRMHFVAGKMLSLI